MEGSTIYDWSHNKNDLPWSGEWVELEIIDSLISKNHLNLRYDDKLFDGNQYSGINTRQY